MFICIVLVGIVFGISAILAWNRTPDAWFCDYGERASATHRNRSVSVKLWGPLFSGCFAAAGLWLSGPHFSGSVSVKEVGSLAAAGAVLWLLLLIAMSDWKFMIIPDQFVLGLILVGLAGDGRVTRLAAGLICGCGFWVLAEAACLLSTVRWGIGGRQEGPSECEAGPSECEVRPSECGMGPSECGMGSSECEVGPECEAGPAHLEGFGFGDVKLIFALGFLLGISGGLFILFAGSLLCGIHCGILAAAGRISLKEKLPFGPYLCAAAAFCILAVR